MNDETANSEPADQVDVDAELQAELDAQIAEAREDDNLEEIGAVQDEPDYAAEIADLKDQVLRAKAEVENTRRIAAREKLDASKYALTNFARDILRVADNLGFALMSVTEEARKDDQNLDNLYVGIDMTQKELISVFGSHNIKPVAADGEAFDHNVHEAVQQVEDLDVAANTVMKTLRGGFTLHDRLLRPAQVIVSTGGPKAEAETKEAVLEIDTNALAPGQNIDQET